MRRPLLLAFAVILAATSAPVVSFAQSGRDPEADARRQEEAASKKRKQKEVIGVRLTEYLMLPPRARLSITYNGEHGAEGFLNLKRF